MSIDNRFFQQPILAKVAKSEVTRDRILTEGCNCLYVGTEIILLPHEIMVHPKNIDEIYSLVEYDVIEFYSDTKYHVYYSDTSNDNLIFVTNKCNSNCIMCPCSIHERTAKNIETVDRLCRIVEYFPSDARFITITGGEPTLIKEDLITLMEKIHSHFEDFTRFLFLTNGRSFSNKAYFERLNRVMPQNMRFAIPIYGGNAADHDAITQAPGSFEQACAGIRRLASYKKDIEIRIVVSKLNYMNMDQVARFIVNSLSGIDHIHIMATEMRGAAALNRDRVWVEYADAFQASKTAIRIFMQHGIDVQLYNFPLCKVDQAFWPLCAKSISDYKVSYGDSCDRCMVKEICGGVFNTTLRLSKMKLNPVLEVQNG